MPSNPGTPGSLEETLATQELYDKVLSIVRTSSSADALWGFGVLGWYETETRTRLKKLLGNSVYNDVIGEKTTTLTPEIIQNITSRMIETNHGVHALLKDLIKDPKAAQITVGGAAAPLSNYITDASSEDARVLAWFYENMAKKAGKERAFDYIANAAEAGTLTALLKARKLYDELLSDETNFDIGESGAATPDPNTQIGDLEIQLKKAEKNEIDAETRMQALLSTKADANVTAYEARLERASTAQTELSRQIAALNKKRIAVKSKLDEFHGAVAGLPGVAFTLTTTPLAAKLNKSALKTAIATATGNVRLGGTSSAIDKYFTDDSVRARTDGLASTLARVGIQKPTAKEALNRLMTDEYEAALKSMQPEQRAEFLQKMYATLRGTTTDAAHLTPVAGLTPDAADAEVHDDDEKEHGKDDGHAAKNEPWYTRWGKWWTEEGESFLGFYTQSKDDKHGH